jgi:hypothetical protein
MDGRRKNIEMKMRQYKQFLEKNLEDFQKSA